MGNIPRTNPTRADYSFWRYKPCEYKTITATGQVKGKDGLLCGIFTSTGTSSIQIIDTAGTTGTIIHHFESDADTLYSLPEIHFQNGCYINMTASTSATILYK